MTYDLQYKLINADKLLEQGMYDDSVSKFREALLLEPKSNGLANLLVASDLSHLQFLINLEKLHPKSIIVQMFIIRANHKMGNYQQGFSLATNILQTWELDSGVRLQLKSLRFRSAVKIPDEEFLKTDFIDIWNSLSSAKSRRKLLTELLSVNDVKFTHVFQQLAEVSQFSSSITLLFQNKARLLTILDKISDLHLIDSN